MKELELKHGPKTVYDEGYEASQNGYLELANPYDNDDHKYFQWLEGWIDCELFKRKIRNNGKESGSKGS